MKRNTVNTSFSAGVPWDSENFIKLAQTLSLASVTDFHGLYLFNNKAYGGSGKDHLQKSGKDGAELLTYLCKTLVHVVHFFLFDLLLMVIVCICRKIHNS